VVPPPAVATAVARDPSLIEAARLQRSYDRPHAQPSDEVSGMNLVAGWSQLHGGVPGWMVRLEGEILGTSPKGRDSGAILGALHGFEYWQVNPSPGERDFGFSAPVAVIAGLRLYPLRVVVGAGLDAILVDHVKRDTGVGFYAPFALANASIDLDGWRIGADARVERRWQIGAVDHTQYQLTFHIGHNFEAGERKPRR
jgi:hypothetical protein